MWFSASKALAAAITATWWQGKRWSSKALKPQSAGASKCLPDPLRETHHRQTQAHLSPPPQPMIHGQPTLALAEEGSFITHATESEPSRGSAASPGQQLLGNAEAPQWGPCPESTDSLRNLTAFLCLDCGLRKACNMVKFGLTCTGVANNVLTFQEDARMHIFSLNLFLEKEKKNTVWNWIFP